MRSPAPSFHDPSDLEWLSIPTLDALDPETMLENAMAAIAEQAGVEIQEEKVTEIPVESSAAQVN